MGVGEPGGGEREQSQYPVGGLRQGLVDQPEGTGQRAGTGGLLRVVRQLAQLLGDIGDRCHGVGGEPAADHDQGGRLSTALLGEALGGQRVHRDPDLADGAYQQLDGGALVEAADGARADAGDAGERALGGGDHQAAGVVRQQRVDLLGIGGVVEQHDVPVGEGLTEQLGQFVPVRAGRPGDPQLVEEVRAVRSVGTGAPPRSVSLTRSSPSG